MSNIIQVRIDFLINVKYSDLGKYIKRFNFVVTTPITKSAKQIEIEDE